MHAISRGYGDIDYTFLIDWQGRVYEGRHARDYASGEAITGEDVAGNVIRPPTLATSTTAPSGSRPRYVHESPAADGPGVGIAREADRVEAGAPRINPLGASTYTNPTSATPSTSPTSPATVT